MQSSEFPMIAGTTAAPTASPVSIPAAVARSSTAALNNATLPYALALADKGYRQALRDDPGLRGGLSVATGAVTHSAVAEALDLPLADADDIPA